MIPLLWINNAVTILFVISCWWLSHSYALAGKPLGRTISALIGVLAISIAATTFARNMQWDPGVPWVVAKAVMTVLFFAVSARVNQRRSLST